eukprot:s204_g7.t1
MPPFQDEVEETTAPRSVSRAKLFGPEPEEHEPPRKRAKSTAAASYSSHVKPKAKSTPVPFGDEGSETEDESESDDEQRAPVRTTFNLDWSALKLFSQANLLKKTVKLSKAEQKKRPYDNSKRRENAAGPTGTSYKTTALDPERLKKLKMKPTCKCALKSCFQNADSRNCKAFIDSLWDLDKAEQDSFAPCLHRFIRRGRTASGEDPEFDVEIDETETDDLRNFLDAPAKGPLWDTVASADKKITKYLAPGTVMDLFTHYQSTRQLFGSVAVSLSCRILWHDLGYTLDLHIMDESLKHDGSCINEVIARGIERVFELSERRGSRMPSKLIICGDNTVRELKNQINLAYVASLIGHRKLSLACLLFLRKSHTHDRIDQVWGVLARRIANTDTLMDPHDTGCCIQAELSRPGFRSFLGGSTTLNVKKLDSVRDWKSHWQSLGVSLGGGLLEDSTGNHFFLMLRRKGRHQNNHNESFKKQCLQLATGISESYGQPYAKAIQYLKD